MAYLDRPWDSQPDGGLQLNTANPITSDIVNILVSDPSSRPMRPLFPANNTLGGYAVAGIFKVYTPSGAFQGHGGSGYTDDSTLLKTVPTDARGFCLFAYFWARSSSTGLIVEAFGDSGQNDGRLQLNTDGSLTVTANSNYSVTTAAGLVTPGLHTVVFENLRVAGKQSIWLDGALIDSSGTSTAQQAFPHRTIRCGTLTGGGLAIAYAGLALGKNASVFAMELRNSPWVLFAPKRIWLPESVYGTTFTFGASGSVTFSGTAPFTVLLVNAYTFSASGSVVFSGTSLMVRSRAFAPSGIVAFSGSSPFTTTGTTSYIFGASGSVTLSGAAPLTRGKIFLPSGVVTFSGTSPFSSGASTSYTFNTSGSFTLSGTLRMARGRVLLPSGSVSFSGTALWQKGWVYPASGQVQFSGTANMYFTSGLASGLVDRMLKGLGK